MSLILMSRAHFQPYYQERLDRTSHQERLGGANYFFHQVRAFALATFMLVSHLRSGSERHPTIEEGSIGQDPKEGLEE